MTPPPGLLTSGIISSTLFLIAYSKPCKCFRRWLETRRRLSRLVDVGLRKRSNTHTGRNSNHNFKIGIITKEKGIYSIDLGGGFNYVNACPNKIANFPISTIQYRYTNADCNKDIYLEIPPNSRGESPKGHAENQIDQKETYIVKVE